MPSISTEVMEFVSQDYSPAAEMFSDAQLLALDSINNQLAGAQSIEELVDYLFEHIRHVVSCDRIGVAFTSQNQKRIVCRYARADYAPLMMTTGYSEDLSQSTLEQVITRGQIRLIHDLEEYLRQNPASRSTRILIAEGVHTSMTCPLRVGDRNVGIMFLSRRKSESFTSEQVALVHAIISRTAQAIEKIYQIELLDQANSNYMEMLGFVTHELKSPVAGMIMLAQSMKDGFYGPVNPDQQTRLGNMIHKGEYLLSLVRDYLNLARMETGALELRLQQNVEIISRVITPTVEMLAPAIKQHEMKITIDTPEKYLLACDPDLLTIVVTNLLSNAAKYGRPGGEIKLTVKNDSEKFSLSVWNQGPGFSETQRGKLFQKFARLDNPEFKKVKGTGVGLFTTWKIVDLHNGKISADSKQGQWAEFKFEIPLGD